MLNILLGPDWTANSQAVLDLLSADVAAGKGGRILMVPELVSHDTERRLCAVAGNTASRYAEVLSFTRLARRVAEYARVPLPECLDNGGRVVAMASAARQMNSRLKAYAAVSAKPEFLLGLVDAVDEFKRCCIGAEDLRQAAQRTEGSMAQKLEELSLLLEGYDSLCSRGKRDPRDQMNWLLEQLEDCDFAQNHVFYIDGFPDFTNQHMEVLAHLIGAGADITVSMNCTAPADKAMAFEKAGATTAALMRRAKELGIPVKITQIPGRQSDLTPVCRGLFQGKTEKIPQLQGKLRLVRCDSIYDECSTAADRILELVRGGARFRDISLICTDVARYRNTLELVFGRCGIPVYLSGKEEILDKPVIATVHLAMEAALSGFGQREMLRYLRSMLSPLGMDDCDRLENYVLMWNIRGTGWQKPWQFHPRGLGMDWTDSDQKLLEELNAAREAAIQPLTQLQKDFRDAENVHSQVLALYDFLQQIRLADRLLELAENLDREGDKRNAQILNQLWDILISALEQMDDMLGQTAWQTDTFAELLSILLSQYQVGTIPAVLDAVTAGPVSAMRCQKAKHLLILGAEEGLLPGYGGITGVLTDQERTALRNLGVPLTGGALDGLQTQFGEIYGVFCGAQETVTLFCSEGQPSFVYRRLLDMAGQEEMPTPLGGVLADPVQAGAYFARSEDKESALQAGVEEEYDRICQRRSHQLGCVSRDRIRDLYGDTLYLSASQVDRQAECRLSYFLKYGLRVEERKTAQIDPAEFGTYVHAVLEHTAKTVMDRGGFRKVSMEETLQIAQECSDAYGAQRFSQMESQRVSYLFRRNVQEVLMVVRELWQEMQECQFVPTDFELAFGDGGKMPAISLSGKTMTAKLRGFVDRVDVWQSLGRTYFRVVDYKTGKKDFDYCDIQNGLGLQMLLYLFALQQEGEDLLGENPVPAGVQYFPARAPMVAADGLLSEEEAEKAREKLWKRKGLLLQDEDVLRAMEDSDSPKRLCCSKKADGSFSGDLADRKQFDILREYVFLLVGKMVDDIASGCVDPNPYTRGSAHDACRFCPYGSICHPAYVEGRRNYKTISAKTFWESLERRKQDG